MALLRDEDVLDLLALLRPALEAVPGLALRPSIQRLTAEAAGAWLAAHYAAEAKPEPRLGIAP